MKKILILVPGYLPGFKSGGPVKTVSNMVAALGDELCFSVLCLDTDHGNKIPYSNIEKTKWNRQGKAEVFYVARGFRGMVAIARILTTKHFDILYLNSFFSFQFSIMAMLLTQIFKGTKPSILGPRGEFSVGAIALKPLRKRVYIYLSKLSGVYDNVIWHASTKYEADDIKRVMGTKSTVSTAIDLASPGDDIELSSRSDGNALRIIFVSRISPKKNLFGALSMLRMVSQKVYFDVYGPTEDKAYWTKCLDAAADLPANIFFTYCGELQPFEVAPTFVKYDLFLFPTFGENYGHVIAEALSAGVPVLISDTTPWRNLEQTKLGWEISLDRPDHFIACIEECCAKSADEYNKWRREIRRWAVSNIGSQAAMDENRRLFSNLD